MLIFHSFYPLFDNSRATSHKRIVSTSSFHTSCWRNNQYFRVLPRMNVFLSYPVCFQGPWYYSRGVVILYLFVFDVFRSFDGFVSVVFYIISLQRESVVLVKTEFFRLLPLHSRSDVDINWGGITPSLIGQVSVLISVFHLGLACVPCAVGRSDRELILRFTCVFSACLYQLLLARSSSVIYSCQNVYHMLYSYPARAK